MDFDSQSSICDLAYMFILSKSGNTSSYQEDKKSTLFHFPSLRFYDTEKGTDQGLFLLLYSYGLGEISLTTFVTLA